MKQLKKDIILANVPKNRINLDIFEEIDSTNDFLKKNIQSNEFNLVASEKQTNGKGRRGKKWHSPQNGNIYMSISTKNTFKSGPLSLITGIICTKVLSNISQTEEIGLKWPNDLVFNNKKIGGILVEKDIYANEEKTIIGRIYNILQFIFGKTSTIKTHGIYEETIDEIAEQLEGFSGREIAKLMISLQALAYAQANATINANMLTESNG